VDRTIDSPDLTSKRAPESALNGQSTVAADSEVLAQRCGLVDRSERGKLALSGADAVNFLNGQVTNELADLAPGEGRYAAFLTHKGKMLGDLRILAVGRERAADDGAAIGELLLDTERVALQALFDMIRRFRVGYDVELQKRTLECSLLSLAGPRTLEVVSTAVDTPLDPPAREHAHVAAAIAGRAVRLVGTVERGIDVLVGHDAAVPAEREAERAVVQEALVAAGAEPVSIDAVEVLRVEHGIPRFGVDLDESTIPQEAGLNDRAVSFTKGCYVGQETVARLHYRGKPNRHLRGLEMTAPVPSGAELRAGERAVGHLGSSVVSPRLGPIGLALVRREAGPGELLSVGADGVQAKIVSLPFG
jgi:folate-binding protein YgfZ